MCLFVCMSKWRSTVCLRFLYLYATKSLLFCTPQAIETRKMNNKLLKKIDQSYTEQ